MAKRKPTKSETIAVTKEETTKKCWTAAKNLQVGDKLESSTEKILSVTSIEVNNHRCIVLFDGDMELDFDNYHQLQVNRKIK